MRVAIANDLAIVREVLRQIVQLGGAHEIAWYAADGAEAVAKALADPPDVILMDLVMPRLDGAQATRQIMKQRPCPILVVTAGVSINFGLVCDALGAGAYDAICTPSLVGKSVREAGAELLARLERVDRISRRMHSKPAPPLPKGALVDVETQVKKAPLLPPIIALGASTGGPPAIAAVLGSIPKTAAACIVIVQHIDAEFAPALADWLSNQASRKVHLVCHGDEPVAGATFLASSNDHLLFAENFRFAYSPVPIDHPYRPSVDILFRSLAVNYPGKGAAALLTGIGRDGAIGLGELKKCGWLTVAQNEASCVVFGMPAAAIAANAAVQVLPITQIGSALYSASTAVERTV